MIPRGTSLVTHKHLEAPAPATAAMGVTTTVDICPWATVHASLSIPWENSLVLATPNPLVEVTIAATGLGIIARTTDGGAVTAVVAASAMTVIVGMTARTSRPTAALEFERLNVLFLLGLIREDSLENVGPAIRLDPDALKELHDVRIPEVKSTIRDCRDATGKYASRRGCDTVLVRRAQIACQVAYEWTRQVLARYRRDQFHLGGNTS